MHTLTTTGLASLALLTASAGALAQEQTFQLTGTVVGLVDELGVFTDVGIGDEASGLLQYDPAREPLAPLDFLGRAEFEIQTVEATIGGSIFSPVGPAFGAIAVGSGAFEGVSEELLGVLPAEIFGVGLDAARFFASLEQTGGSNSASINASFTGPENWLNAQRLPGEDIFTADIIDSGNIVVSFASIGLVEVDCTDGSDGPCFTFDIIESTAVIEVETVSSQGVTLWVSPAVRDGVSPCVGDLNNDGVTDLGDFGAFGLAFNTSIDDPDFNPDADFDGDGDVDLGDFGAFGADFGCTG